MSAKLSPRGTPFFAHRRRPEDCWLGAESLEHRLLKLALANAARAAGWHAELEVSGDGETRWRADVLATSPDGARRIALEAQLAAVEPEEVSRRTENYRASGVEVCWVTDKQRPWLGAAPYLMVTPDDSGLRVVLGLLKFTPDWCRDRSRCDQHLSVTSPVWSRMNPGRSATPCPGHGQWHAVTIPLDEVVGFILAGQAWPIAVDGWFHLFGADSFHRFDGGHQAWTAPAYAAMWQVELEARRRVELAEQMQTRDQLRHQARIEALAKRQDALRWRACQQLGMRAGSAAKLADGGQRVRERWAMGVPVVLVNEPGRVLGVVCPVASRITPTLAAQLAGVTVVVADEAERARIASVCSREQQFLVLEVPSG